MDNKSVISVSSNEERGEEPVLKEGMVWKCGRKVTSTWKRRYFVLKPTTLSYHAGMGTENEEKRFIEITQNSTVTLRPDKHPLAFQVRTPGFRKITARCETDEELNIWVTAIEECIKQAPAWPIKCVVVGDDEEQTFGKRIMISRYLSASKSNEAKVMNPHAYTSLNKSRTRVVKTPHELLGNVDILMEYDNAEWVKLMLWNLDGREQFATLRSLAYPHSDIYIVVFSVSDAQSFEKVETYMKEIKSNTVNTGNPLFLLVGTRFSSELVAVGFNQGEERARTLGFSGYVECRVDSEEECEQVFKDAVRLVIEKSVMVYASTNSAAYATAHSRSSSGILSNLANRLRLNTKKANAGEEPVESQPSPSRKGTPSGRFFPAISSLRSNSQKKLDKTSSAKDVTNENEQEDTGDYDDSDEGSLIGVEVDEADEARIERDFGFSDMKDDTAYTQKILNRTSSYRRSGDQSNLGDSSRTLLANIQETAAEEQGKELEELRSRAAKRERELERMKHMMDTLKTYNNTVEEQLKAMREELAVLSKNSGTEVALSPPMMPTPKHKEDSGTNTSVPKDGKASPSLQYRVMDGLPPLSPSNNPARTSFRSARSASVFF